MIRSSLASNPSATRLRGWHITGIYGPFAAAAACASLLKLNPEQTAWALGLAGTQGAGTWAFNADGTMSKRLHAGKAAHSGVLAAELAALGFTGPTQIYEFGDGGVLKAHSDDSDASTAHPRPRPRLAHRHQLDQALLLLRQHACLHRRRTGGAPQNRRAVGHATPRQGRPVERGRCAVRFCLCAGQRAERPDERCVTSSPRRWSTARCCRRSSPTNACADPALVRLAAQLECEHDPKLDALYPAHFAGWVAAEKDGQWVREDILNPTGSIDNPVDAARRHRKVPRHQSAAAGRCHRQGRAGHREPFACVSCWRLARPAHLNTLIAEYLIRNHRHHDDKKNRRTGRRRDRQQHRRRSDPGGF